MSDHHARSHRLAAFTLAELLVILAVMVIVVLVILPSLGHRSRPIANRSVCGGNVKSIITSMMIYSVSNKDEFPMAGIGTEGGHAVGFREGNRRTGRGAILANNVTANLWMMIRDGSMGPKSFICPQTTDVQDPLTVSQSSRTVAELDNTWDFLGGRNLSYSMVNVYSPNVDWTTEVPADYVLAGDNNNAEGPDIHRVSADANPTEDQIEQENSGNHGREGQSLLFGDSHVQFHQDPFQGRSEDNVYALIKEGSNVPPTFGHDDITDPHDVVLLPVTGNGGGAGSLSGLTGSYGPSTPPTAAGRAFVFVLQIVLLVVVLAVVFLPARAYWRRRHATELTETEATDSTSASDRGVVD